MAINPKPSSESPFRTSETPKKSRLGWDGRCLNLKTPLVYEHAAAALWNANRREWEAHRVDGMHHVRIYTYILVSGEEEIARQLHVCMPCKKAYHPRFCTRN